MGALTLFAILVLMETSLAPALQENDPKSITRDTRITIGFSARDTWRDAPAVFDDHRLTIQGHPVMEDWEESYMCELATIAASNGGRVLEVGFGMGISARFIQEHAITEHYIVEANQDVFEHLLDFQDSAKIPLLAYFGFWEDVTRLLPSGSISGILFDTYPLREEDIHQNHFPFFKEAYRLLAPGGVLTYYSDEAEDFSPLHLHMLHEAGFTDIQKKVCELNTPPDCAYWKSKTMIAPIIRK